MAIFVVAAFAALPAGSFAQQTQAPEAPLWQATVDGTNIKMGIASGGLHYDDPVFIQCLKRGSALVAIQLPEKVVQRGKKLTLCFSDDARKICNDYTGEADGLLVGGIRDTPTTDPLFEMFSTARQLRVTGPQLDQVLTVKGLSEATAAFVSGCSRRPQ